MAKAPSEKALAEQLQGVPLFAQCSLKQRRSIAKLGKVLSWKEGATAIKQGSRGAAFFLILDGSVDIIRDGTNLARLGAGDFVGEMALLSGDPRNADVVATQATSVFALGRPGFAAAIKGDPGLAMTLLETMAARQSL